MPVAVPLLKCIAGGILKHALNLLAGGLPVGDVLVEAARTSWDKWRQGSPEAERRAELQRLAEPFDEQISRQLLEAAALRLRDQFD